MKPHIKPLLAEIRGCAACAAHLPHGPRPVIQFSPAARLVIVGQAPGVRVHETGIPWNDDSGRRLRAWTGLDDATFYDAARVALLPMGFCYPGKGDGADLPPRPECAPLWHERLLALLPAKPLMLLVGTHAQARYLAGRRKPTLAETVRDFQAHLPGSFPLPHPSWRSTGWMKRNPWFAKDVLPRLRAVVRGAIK